MPKEICVECGRTMLIQTVGAVALEFQDKEKQKPYRLWSCDVSQCPECGYQVIARLATKPFAEHFEPSFEDQRAQAMKGTFIEFY